MIAKSGTTDLSDLVGYGYTYALVPQYGETITTMDGKDHTPKIRDRVSLTVPFIALTLAQLSAVLALFPAQGSYISWTFYDPYAGAEKTLDFIYSTRKSSIVCKKSGGTEYYSGLVLELLER